MGIQDRDYYRESSSGFFDVWGRQGATVWIIVITSVVFLLQCFSPPPASSPLAIAGQYDPQLILEGEVWRLVTPLVLHAGFMHLLFNMLVVYFFGSRIEEAYGTLEFVLFYILSGLFASTVYLLLYVAGRSPSSSASVPAGR